MFGHRSAYELVNDDSELQQQETFSDGDGTAVNAGRSSKQNKLRAYGKELIHRLNNEPFWLNLIQCLICVVSFTTHWIIPTLPSVPRGGLPLLYVALCILTFVITVICVVCPRRYVLTPLVTNCVFSLFSFVYSFTLVTQFYCCKTIKGGETVAAVGCLAYGQSSFYILRHFARVFISMRRKEMMGQ